MRRALLCLLAWCTPGVGCVREVELEIVPPWSDGVRGVLVLLDRHDGALLERPLRFEGRGPIPLSASVDQPYRIWAETFPAEAPALGDTCELTYVEGEELPAGDAWISAELETGARTAVLEATKIARPLSLKTRCPPRRSRCERLRVLEYRIDGLNGDLYGVSMLGPNEALLGGVGEATFLSSLGIIRDGLYTPVELGAFEDAVGRLDYQPGRGGWMSTLNGNLAALGPDASIRARFALGGREVTTRGDPDQGYALYPGPGHVRRYTPTSTTGVPVGSPDRLRRLVAVGPRLYAHDGSRVLYSDQDGTWSTDTPPGDELGDGEFSVQGERLTLFSPRGIFTRRAPGQAWEPLAAPFPAIFGGWWNDVVFLAVDTNNLVHLHDGYEWCTVVIQSRSDFKAAAFSPDRREAMVAGSNLGAEGAPLLVHLILDE